MAGHFQGTEPVTVDRIMENQARNPGLRLQEVGDEAVSPSAHELQERKSEMAQPILFFDGVCGLCSRSVDFAMARDPEGRLLYSPLQGDTARELLNEQDRENVDTVIFLPADRSRVYRRSAAAVRVLWLLGFPWNLCGWLLWVVPLPLRNLGYRLVSQTRYRFFGKHETCRMPTPEERCRFLP